MTSSEYCIHSAQQLAALWERTYHESGRPDWSQLLPYYADDIHFVDPVQEIRGLADFRAMVERLARRSSDLQMEVLHVSLDDRVAFVEWVLTLTFRKTRRVPLYGLSRLMLNDEGKIVDQRDLYDLWGTIFANIPGLGRAYRAFMRKVFG